MFADIHFLGIIQAGVHRCAVVRLGTGLEYFFQRSCPGLHSLIHGNLHVTIYKGFLIGHLTDLCVSDRKLVDLVFRNFAHDVAEARCKQFFRCDLAVDLHTLAVTEGHAAHSCHQTVGIQRVSGIYPAGLDVCL